MQKLIDDGVQVDSVVTDPPYHLTSIVKRFGKTSLDDDTKTSQRSRDRSDGFGRLAAAGFMGKEWDGGDIAFRPETWELALKLLKPGGHILAFSASRNYHRMAVAIEDAGFEIRDQMMWLYGSGFPKSHDVSKSIDKFERGYRKGKSDPQSPLHKKYKHQKVDGNTKNDLGGYMKSLGNSNQNYIPKTPDTIKWEGWGTALKPAHEPIVMARKPISEKSIAENVLKHGVGGINIDGCRIEGDSNTERKETKRKSRSEDGVWTDGNSGMKAEGSQYADADPKGRFPANVMHDGSEEVKDIFPTTSKSAGGGGTKTISKNKTVFTSGWGNKEYDETIGYGDDGSAARYFYCPKTSKAEKNRGLEDFEAKPMAWGNQAKAELKRGNKDFVGGGDGTKHNKVEMRVNTHPTVKPIELMKYLCRMVTPKGGTVLDPFMGSGSTGMAAKDEGFEFIGIEKEKEYFDIAEARIKVTAPLEDFMK